MKYDKYINFDISLFPHVAKSGNIRRAKIISAYLRSSTEELFLMTKSCLPETVLGNNVGRGKGAIFKDRPDSGEYNAIAVISLKNDSIRWVSIRTAVGIRPFRSERRSFFPDAGIVSSSFKNILLDETKIQKFDSLEIDKFMRQFSQISVNVNCILDNGDQIAFPVEYCNYGTADIDNYLQPICYPSIYVSDKEIYQGAFAARISSHTGYAEFLAATKFNPFGQIRGERLEIKASPKRLWSLMKYTMFRITTCLVPCEYYNEVTYEGNVECDFYRIV